jgi:hypothetical protein
MKIFNLVLILGLTMAACTASANFQEFILVNETGVDIAGLYISPVAKQNWGEDVLAVKTLPSGSECQVHFLSNEKADFWDLMIVDQEGSSLEWPELSLSSNAKVTLSIENGTPVATYE